MSRFGLNTVFSKLFASVMLTLVLFSVAMVSLTNLIYDNTAETRWEILARQIVNQIDPFVDELDNATTMNERLQARFMLAIIKKSFDIFDGSLQAKLALYDRDGHLLIQTEDSTFPPELPETPSIISSLIPFMNTAPTSVQVEGDRDYTLVYAPRNPPKRSELWAVLNLFTGTLLLITFMGLVLWWIARSMTWRIDQMNQQMAQLGEGDFSVRVPAKGTDEIASLARGFNQAAQKIEQLINANNLLLAHASHEIRTPITRIRLQIEMMQMLTECLPDETRKKFDKRAVAVNRDLNGLNDLVESILLVSRLDAGHAAEPREPVDLYELVNQECQHYPEAVFYGQHITIEGQPKLLIHLIRNLLNNAMIHGVPPIQVHLYGVMSEANAYTPPSDLLQLELEPIDSIADAATKNDGTQELTLDQASLGSSKLIGTELGSTELDSTDIGGNTASANTPMIRETLDSQIVDNNPSSSVKENQHQPHLSERSIEQPSASQNLSIISDMSVQTDISDIALVNNKTVDFKNKPTVTATLQKKLKRRAKTDEKEEQKSSEGLFPKLRLPKPTKTEPLPNYAVLAVIDKGMGIPVEKREEIFSPFVRLQQKRKGSGLGLSLVAQIVEAHNGIIRSDTYQGHTRFIVILPTHPKQSLLKESSDL